MRSSIPSKATPQPQKDMAQPEAQQSSDEPPSIGQLIQDRIEAKRLLNIMREQGLLADE